MNTKPNYTVFAGVNGAGKSTLYEGIDKAKLGVRINSDEIAKELGDFNNSAIQIKAGKIAVVKIKDCIDKRLSFNQETTLTGRSILNQMKKLKDIGYKIDLNYVGLKSKELANERVRIRVKKGGHDIPTETIYKRYQESIDNLVSAMKLADNIKVFDNSDFENRNILLHVENNKMIYKIKDIPEWFKKPLKQYLNQNVKMKIQEQYKDEFSGIKYLSDDSANILNNLNQSKNKIHTIKEVKELYRLLGSKIDGVHSNSDIVEFNNLEKVINELKICQINLKQEQAQQKCITKNISKHMDLEL